MTKAPPQDGVQAVVFVDGASKGNPGPAGAGAVIASPHGHVLEEVSIPLADATNNVAEYTGLIEGLRAARKRGLRRIEVRTDSELMHRQLNGTYRVKSPRLRQLHAVAQGLIRGFAYCVVRHVPRERNQSADRLAAAAAAQAARSMGRQQRPTQGNLDL